MAAPPIASLKRASSAKVTSPVFVLSSSSAKIVPAPTAVRVSIYREASSAIVPAPATPVKPAMIPPTNCRHTTIVWATWKTLATVTVMPPTTWRSADSMEVIAVHLLASVQPTPVAGYVHVNSDEPQLENFNCLDPVACENSGEGCAVCAPGCMPDEIGDGVCNPECWVAACGWDFAGEDAPDCTCADVGQNEDCDGLCLTTVI